MPSSAQVDSMLGDEGMHARCRVEQWISWLVRECFRWSQRAEHGLCWVLERNCSALCIVLRRTTGYAKHK